MRKVFVDADVWLLHATAKPQSPMG